MTDKERIAELEKENAVLQQKYLEERFEKAKLVKELKEAEDSIKAFKDREEFGHNKANEWHYLRKNPKDLPQCDENTQLIFYVKDWGAISNAYYYHFALGFYRPPFIIGGGKMFVEESKGYSSEHSPEHVIMWKELVKPEVEE